MSSPPYTLDLRRGALGTAVLPGSKSLSNRVLLLSALAEGTTEIHGLLASDDTAVMVACLRQLGVSLTQTVAAADPASGVGQPVWRVEGTGGVFPARGSAAEPIDCFVGNSGLTVRTLLPAIVVAQAGTMSEALLHGVPRMHERPIGDLVDGLRQLGADIHHQAKEGFPPLRVTGVALAEQPVIRVRGDTSSQFLTGILQAAPQLAQQWGRPVTIAVEGPLISRPYVDLSLSMLAAFGVHVAEPQPNCFVVQPGVLVSPGRLVVEGDASSASYFLAAGLLGCGPVRVQGVGRTSLQGDVRFADALQAMGAEITWGEDFIESRAATCDAHGRPVVQGVDLDCNHIPDAAMTLVAVALYAKTPTRLRNIGSWRVKETDRIAAMAAEARKLGAAVEEGADFIVITPPAQLRTASIHTYDDHRVAMSFSLTSFVHAGDLGQQAKCAGEGPSIGGEGHRHFGEGVNAPVGETVVYSVETRGYSPEARSAKARSITIEDPACVNKTFPTYFDAFADICAQAVPVVAIDGPTASGKGTVASRVAQALGFAYLDSGALYRLLALASMSAGVAPSDEDGLGALAASMDIGFEGEVIWLDGRDVTAAIRSEAVGNRASEVAAMPAVRQALLRRQRDFARLPGLVADGRDMGSVVFPQAQTKVFLTATAQARAARRVSQLHARGEPADLATIKADLAA
ncbi:MAG: 3-phosphoshikimate 1-carboxyvinyltransferase, partial [Proteobacteria bacterium]|nr:3-phosphoshikimate 1-carboxyvinyltransferase [Pseudomonadota bacterium]